MVSTWENGYHANFPAFTFLILVPSQQNIRLLSGEGTGRLNELISTFQGVIY